ncbi:MAG: ankyrin repeat domain-containing protein [Pirellulales bacterium]|nr:ankyrin repeat domain-containing protein [Pirellulales bacterium]
MRPRTLKSAAEQGDLAAVKYHLSRGADVDATTASGHFAIGGAIINGHAHVVEYLIANGADIDQKSEFGWSPLYLAAWAGSAECTALLLLAGAKINTKTIGGWNSPSGYTIHRYTLPPKEGTWLS